MKPATSTIIQYWAQGEQPISLRAVTIGWQRLNPGWAYRCFNRTTASVFFKDALGVPAQQDFLSIRLPAMQADVFRVAYIMTHGGLWVDAATTCLSPLDHWLDPQSPLVLLRKPHMDSTKVWNGFIYAHQPHHQFLRTVWRRIASLIARRAGTGVWKMFGPGLFGETLMDTNLAKQVYVVSHKEFADHVRIGSSRLFMPAEQHWSIRQRNETLYI
jgi:mannosyltransferase OCH1-like enzyme